MASETQIPIVCATTEACKIIAQTAQNQDLPVPKTITLNELRGYNQSVYVDNIDAVLEKVLGVKIEVGTITEEQSLIQSQIQYSISILQKSIKALSNEYSQAIEKKDYNTSLNICKNIEHVQRILQNFNW